MSAGYGGMAVVRGAIAAHGDQHRHMTDALAQARRQFDAKFFRARRRLLQIAIGKTAGER